MINTLYSLNALDSSRAFFLALLVGFGFGFALERAGFSSSKRLAGVFYFKDMAVVKVMFSGLVTAMLGLSYLVAFGWIHLDQIYLMPTIYGAQIVGGLLFGVGFAMGAWCPGTAAAGLAAGRIDALVFLIGTIGGSILFNEFFPLMRSLYTAGDRGALMAYTSAGMSRNGFILVFTIVAVAAFWLSEWAEKVRTGKSAYLGSPFLKAFSVALVALAAGLSVFNPATGAGQASTSDSSGIMETVDKGMDHIEPEELADRLMAGESDLVAVDVRPENEFKTFHIRGAVNISLAQLSDTLQPSRNKGTIVLYSNGMTHPAQARDALQREGFNNVYMLTDGLNGFRDRCLKPVSLRPEPLSADATARVNAWRTFFFGQESPARASPVPALLKPLSSIPQVIETTGLAARLGTPGLKIIDLRAQPEYNMAHIPGSLSLNVESLRGNIGGVPSLLLPPALLAAQFSLMGLQPSDQVVILPGEKFHDATLTGMAFERLAHTNYAVLNGGFIKWAQEALPANTALPEVAPSKYPALEGADHFTVDYRKIVSRLGKPGTVIIDVRPADYYTGKKSDEARAGHIPGAINHPYTEDVLTASNKVVSFKSADSLSAAYSLIIPDRNTEIIVHCRTGHQASQTFFILKRLLGYPNVLWYDASWTEWAARQELPVAK